MIAESWTGQLLWILAVNTVLAGGLALLALVASRAMKSPALAHSLWLLVLIKLLTPPIVEVPVFERTAPPPAAAVAPTIDGPPISLVQMPAPRTHTTPDSPRAQTPHGWPAWLLGLWAAGATLALGVALCRALRFHRSLRSATPAPSRTVAQADQLRRRLGLRRRPRIRLLPGRLSPMLWAIFGRAQILFPSTLDARLSDDQRRTLLAHELAHLARRDHWVRNLEMLVRAVYWWNPLTGWICRELRAAEEACCDALVLQTLPDASGDYAGALLNTLEFISGAPPMPLAASGASTTFNQLKRRLTMITRGDDPRPLTRIGRIAVLGLALLALPLFPGFAEKPDKRTRAAVAHGAKLLDKLGRDKDAALLWRHLKGEDHKTLGALKRSIDLLRKAGRDTDASRLEALAHDLASGRHLRTQALQDALKRAAMLLEVVEAHDDAKRVWHLLERSHGKKSQGHAQKKDRVDLHAAWKKLQHLVHSGKLTEKQAHAKMAALKKKHDAGSKQHSKANAELAAVKKKIWGAVESGKMTEQEAREIWKKYLASRKKHHGQKKTGSKLEAYLESAGKKLKQAVEAGELSEQEARQKWAAILEEVKAKHHKK